MASGFGEIAEQLRRSTVTYPVGRRRLGLPESSGRMTVIVVTNAHVVPVREYPFNCGMAVIRAAIRTRDPRRDFAQLHIDATNLPAASSADSSRYAPGLAIALESDGLCRALATGVIHAVGSLRGLGRQTWVQADVRLAPGNSGGRLQRTRPRHRDQHDGRGTLALAIPSNAVRDFLSSGPATLGWESRSIHVHSNVPSTPGHLGRGSRSRAGGRRPGIAPARRHSAGTEEKLSGNRRSGKCFGGRRSTRLMR